MTDVMSIRDLVVRFRTPRGPLEAVRGVTLHIREGASVGIVGESGSGKTVLSRAAMGLLSGSSVERQGSVTFNGSELIGKPREEIRHIFGTGMAMIFQDPMTALNPVRRVGSQIAEGPRIRLGMSNKLARERAVEVLAMVGIPDPAATMRKFPYQLSGGMRQRVMIAIAIACKPTLLFADEPTTALDVTVQAQILELLAGLEYRLMPYHRQPAHLLGFPPAIGDQPAPCNQLRRHIAGVDDGHRVRIGVQATLRIRLIRQLLHLHRAGKLPRLFWLRHGA